MSKAVALIAACLFGAAVAIAVVYAVGETVETVTEYSNCPPYWKCNGTPETNAANCECWNK